MKYTDQILENKTFNFVKQLLYNILLSICIMLVIAVAGIYIFKFRPYVVWSGSMTPTIMVDDVVVVKSQKEYKEGDVIKFQWGTLPVTHRIIEIKEENNQKIYVCRGDAVQETEKQNVTASMIEGKVVMVLPGFGFFTRHKLLLVAIAIGILCVFSTISNEVEIKRAWRLM